MSRLLKRTFLILWFAIFCAPVFAASWGGYVNHEGASEKVACYEAKKHAYELCRKHGGTLNSKDASFSCKTHKTAMYNKKKMYFVNLVFSCHDRVSQE